MQKEKKHLKYPKINEDNDVRKILTVRKIISKLYKIGISQRMMARFFGVDRSTIKHYLSPAKITREKRYKYKSFRELPETRHDRREAIIEKMLEWERFITRNRRKDRKRKYRQILTIRRNPQLCKKKIQ